MVLSDHSIKEAIAQGRIIIDPLGDDCVQPSSVDLHIDQYFRVFRNHTQGVIDVRCCLDWLEAQGYNRLGIVGTSLGSCYAFIATAHDPRIQVAAFNHASTYFADVVWHGQSTRHIREGLETAIDLENLRQVWRAVSPMVYFDKFSRWPRRSLIIYAKYDMTFLPEFSEQVVEEFAKHNLDHKVVVLPCGHYTMGETPYKYMDGWQLVSFLRTAFD